ncbi:MAG: hypothetical protein HKO91_08675 [Desulfobacterales bacterium]|nr:hypothetical protein [Desulfobacterales bacterium]
MTIGIENRSGIERRLSNGLNIRSLIFGGSRILIRRQEDSERLYFVDQYSPKLFLAIVAILFLCVIDALLTFYLIGHGAYETNPIFAYTLDVNPYTSIILKYASTAVVAVCLLLFKCVVFKKFNISTHTLLYFIAGFYLAVVAWELYLLSNVSI